MNDLTELLADCDARGILLHPAGDGGLTIDAPEDTLTSELIGRLKACKGGLLALLRPTSDVAIAPPVTTSEAVVRPAKAVCRCGAIVWRDVPIHGGQSVRRDCGQCGRFACFPVWYGKTTLHNAQ